METTSKFSLNRSFDKAGQKSYSGCDIVPTLTIGSNTFVLGNISAISYSIHRDVTPVRVLGHTYPKGFVSASRTIAGTLVFTVFDRHVLSDVINKTITQQDLAVPMSSPLVDQLPPFDVGIIYSNEYGNNSYMRIYGLQITDEGQTHSISDTYTENVMQYVARDIDLMVGDKTSSPPSLLSFFNERQKADQTNVQVLQKLLSNKGELEKDLFEVQKALRTNSEVWNSTRLAELSADAQNDILIRRTQMEISVTQLTNELADIERAISGIIVPQAPNQLRDSPYAYDRTRLNRIETP